MKSQEENPAACPPRYIYILGCNVTGPKFFFLSIVTARKVLAYKANKIKYAPGVDCFREDLDSISWLFGWEEARVSWSIRAVPISTSLKDVEGLI